MASFLKNLITNAANSVSEGIKKRIEDGTFNRMAEGVDKGVNNVAAGMISIVGLAEKAFNKLSGKKDEAEGQTAPDAAEQQAAPETSNFCEQAANPVPPVVPESVTAPESPTAPDGVDDPESTENLDPYAILPPEELFIDNQMKILADENGLDEDEVKLLSMARLTVQTALFFANCDGNYTKKEKEFVVDFESMICGNMVGIGDSLERVFDNIERPYTIEEIILMTRRLMGRMDEQGKKDLIESVHYLLKQILEVNTTPGTKVDEYYAIWRREFC